MEISDCLPGSQGHSQISEDFFTVTLTQTVAPSLPAAHGALEVLGGASQEGQDAVALPGGF